MSTKRECGDCTLCCKVMAIKDPELVKPANQWCSNCAVGTGCKIYQNRPVSCRQFECLWLQGILPEEFYPRTAHFVADATGDGKRIVLHVDPNYADTWKHGAVGNMIDALVKRGVDVIIVTGDKRLMLTTDPQTVILLEQS